MHTKDQLAKALREVHLHTMAEEAERGYYDDFLSPLPTPNVVLCNNLALAASGSRNRAVIMALRKRVIDGEFDATIEESEDWARSPEGQDTLRKLIT
jgi:hypothetical protein